ncbi:RES family NAD+ phosphorylase [Allorhizobium undicola]|uniref:RES family NAD+ phosphorylase n=1 Tax=Allorhizobium undicola TaxID=78527 RepID=UPI003D33CA09
MRYDGKLYRALNPVYAREPLSGRGAELYGGRFNRKGVPALYTSLSILTAIREANQVGSLQPLTLVSYEAAIELVFDCRDERALASHAMSDDVLASPAWRDDMALHGLSATQRFAESLMAAGFNGLIVRSFAPGAAASDLNMVLWRWGPDAPCALHLIDDEDRLSRA